MRYTIERLLAGSHEIGPWYAAARERWKQIFQEPAVHQVETFAKQLSAEQFWFEHHCGGRAIGQEIMVHSGFGSLYSTQDGFGENNALAHRLLEAFAASSCSLEVKRIARDATKIYSEVVEE